MSAFESVEVVLGPNKEALARYEVMGEVVAPGLAITPEIVADADGNILYRGGFLLTHLSTGRRLNGGPWGGSCISCIRAFAKTVVESGIDWTRPRSELAALVAERGDAIKSVLAAAAEMCDANDYCGRLRLPEYPESEVAS